MTDKILNILTSMAEGNAHIINLNEVNLATKQLSFKFHLIVLYGAVHTTAPDAYE